MHSVACCWDVGKKARPFSPTSVCLELAASKGQVMGQVAGVGKWAGDGQKEVEWGLGECGMEW